MRVILLLSLLLSACSPMNHMLGRQVDKATAGMYFNATVIEAPEIVNAEILSIRLTVLGEDGQRMLVVCESDPDLLSRCLKAEPGMMIKVNGQLTNRDGLVVKADYLALK